MLLSEHLFSSCLCFFQIGPINVKLHLWLSLTPSKTLYLLTNSKVSGENAETLKDTFFLGHITINNSNDVLITFWYKDCLSCIVLIVSRSPRIYIIILPYRVCVCVCIYTQPPPSLRVTIILIGYGYWKDSLPITLRPSVVGRSIIISTSS